MKKIIIVSIILISSCLVQACNVDSSREYILFDFENNFDLDRLHWKCHSLFSISDKYTFGSLKSLKVELYPSKYPGVSFRDYKKNWTGYKSICLDVYSLEEKKIDIFIRIDDDLNNSSFVDRYNRKFVLLPGPNNIIIPFSTLKTTGGERQLNLRTICKFLFFVIKPKKKIELYFDNIRLVRTE